MRVLVFGLTTLAVVVGLSVIGLQFTTHGDEEPEPPLGPRLEMTGSSFDLGDVPATEVVERAVVFRNTGVEPLKVSIVKVRPAPDATCGCDVEGFEVRPETVRPGEGGELVFFLKVPEGMAAMEDKMIAELTTNDPTRPTLKISLVFMLDS
jgi:hypothetical protein